VIRADIMAVVQLDGMHRCRFRNEPEILAAWEGARNVAWPGRATLQAGTSKRHPAGRMMGDGPRDRAR
jgi:hypothetical protein